MEVWPNPMKNCSGNVHLYRFGVGGLNMIQNLRESGLDHGKTLHDRVVEGMGQAVPHIVVVVAVA